MARDGQRNVHTHARLHTRLVSGFGAVRTRPSCAAWFVKELLRHVHSNAVRAGVQRPLDWGEQPGMSNKSPRLQLEGRAGLGVRWVPAPARGTAWLRGGGLRWSPSRHGAGANHPPDEHRRGGC